MLSESKKGLTWLTYQRTYRKFTGCEDIDVGARASSAEEGGELTGGDNDESEKDKDTVPVADDSKMPPDAEVLLQHRLDVRFRLEHPREVL